MNKNIYGFSPLTDEDVTFILWLMEIEEFTKKMMSLRLP